MINQSDPLCRKFKKPGWSRSLQILFIMLVIAALFLGGCQVSPGSDTQTTQASTPSPTAAPTLTPTPEPTPTPSPTPAPTPTPWPTPALAADPQAEAYFGPLPTPSQQVRELVHNEVKGIYIGAGGNIVSNLAVARATEVNAVVIDLKESDGIYFDCTVPLALEIGAVRNVINLKSLVEKCHAEGVTVIGRIVCFKDEHLTVARPEFSIRDQAGNPLKFSNEGGKSFASPYEKQVWQYYIDIALDAISFGVDEIQFDYVRFPTGPARGGAKPYFGAEGTVPTRIAAINRFLQTAKVYIQDEQGIPLGADVFAIIMTNLPDSAGLGQEWATVGLTGIDSVSPMIYPSHYANSSTGHYTGNGKGTFINGILFEKPDLEPYGVMYNVLAASRAATEQASYAVNRPWLQAFTASYLPEGYYQLYGAEEIRAQIKAIEDAGFSEWICWDPAATYSNSFFAAQD